MLTIHEQIVEEITKANRILITFNRNWKGDAAASALALKLWLEKRGKEADIVAEKPAAAVPYGFLPGYALIHHRLDNLRRFIIALDISKTAVDQIEYRVQDHTLDFIISPKEGFFTEQDISSRSGGFRYDLIITLGTPDLESLGSIYDNDTQFFFDTTIVNIDHHPANDRFGQINLVNVNAVATAEIMYDLISETGTTLIDADIATCLLAGLIAETKSFKTSNVTPRALTVASDLVAHDARRDEIINALYRSRKLNVLKLWGCVLTRLQNAANGRLVWSMIRAEDFAETGTDPRHLTDIIDELIISLPQAQIIVLLYEEAGKTKAVVHSVKNLDALDLTRPFHGEGNRSLATITLAEPIAQALPRLMTDLEEKIKRLEQ